MTPVERGACAGVHVLDRASASERNFLVLGFRDPRSEVSPGSATAHADRGAAGGALRGRQATAAAAKGAASDAQWVAAAAGLVPRGRSAGSHWHHSRGPGAGGLCTSTQRKSSLEVVGTPAIRASRAGKRLCGDTSWRGVEVRAQYRPEHFLKEAIP